jgi:hypothetical protein
MKNLEIVVISFILLFFAGCSSNSTPTCTDETVKKLALEITYEALFKQLLPQQLQQNYSQIVDESKNSEIYAEYGKIDLQGEGFVYGTMPVKYFLKFAEISKTAATVKDNIAKQIKDLNISFDAIRTSDKNPDLKKTSCAADLVSANGHKSPIKYTAQRTEDKQIWVEVSGL